MTVIQRFHIYGATGRSAPWVFSLILAVLITVTLLLHQIVGILVPMIFCSTWYALMIPCWILPIRLPREYTIHLSLVENWTNDNAYAWCYKLYRDGVFISSSSYKEFWTTLDFAHDEAVRHRRKMKAKMKASKQVRGEIIIGHNAKALIEERTQKQMKAKIDQLEAELKIAQER